MKKLLTILSILILVIGIYGCGSSNPASDDDDDNDDDDTCGDGVCSVSGGEIQFDSYCSEDCDYQSDDVSFVLDNNWATTSPEDDCLDGIDGVNNIEFAVENGIEGDTEEGYSVTLDDDYGISVYRHNDASDICSVEFIYFEVDFPEGNPESISWLNSKCPYISACDSSGIAATCQPGDGREICYIDLEPVP